jgi:branched-chain amino acid transport system ATP-binding protein
MLEVRGLSTAYGNIQALHEVNLSIAAGEIVTLIGANGAGKSTTLMSLCGIVPAQSGDIVFDGESILGLPAEQIVARGLIQVPEGRRIFPQMTVLENLQMGAYLRRDGEGVQQDLTMVCDLFPILATRRQQLGGTLSGGEQQMLAIARALMARPRLLLLDEPSLGLAPLIIQQIFAILRQLNQEHGTTLFLVEQNANQALKLAHRGYVMENGCITLTDSAARLLGDEAVRKAYLGL